ncbi:membrane hypothetical protein [Candidatus Zixiibacteriota bacterium]|nr:membrane hypothetical protein [candidate division Zixibacteria bacterium]
MIDAVASKSKQIAFYALTGFFFSLTFSIALSQILMGVTIFFAAVALLSKEQRQYPAGFKWFYIWTALFVIWSLISSALGPTPIKSLLINKEEWLFFIIPLTAFLITDERKVRIMIAALALSVLLVSLYAAFQHFTGLDLYHHEQLPAAPLFGYRVSGTFSNRLTFGDLFAVAAMLFLPVASVVPPRKGKTILYAVFVMASLAVVFSYGRGPVLVLVSGIILYIIVFHRRKIWSLIAVVAVLAVLISILAPGILSGYERSVKKEWAGIHPSSRISIWKSAARMAADHPFIGVGQGNFEEQFRNYRAPNSTKIFAHGHNDILNIAAYEGIPGAVIYLGMWAAIVFLMLKKMKAVRKGTVLHGLMAGILMASLVFFMTSVYEATFADEEVRQFLMALWGAFIACAGMVKGREELAD